MADKFRVRDLFNPLANSFEKEYQKKTPDLENPYDDETWGESWGFTRDALAREHDARIRQDEEESYERRMRARKKREAREQEIRDNPKGPFDWPSTVWGKDKYHINPEGRALRCRASVNPCPYGPDEHFTMPDWHTPVSSQNVAEWLMEKRYSTVPFSYKISGVGSEDLRRISSRIARYEENPNRIELDFTVELQGISTPLRVSRKVGNTYENRWKSHSYWILEYGDHRVITDRLSKDDLDSFINRYLNIYDGSYDPEIRKELEDELTFRLTEAMRGTEGEASLVRAASVHHSPTPLAFPPSLSQDEEGRWTGMVNYATSTLRPKHLRTRNSLHKETPVEEPVVFAPGFEVYDNDTGQGRASWSVLKEDEGWTITVQGSRGDIVSFPALDPHEATERFRSEYSRRVTSRSRDRSLFYVDGDNDESKRSLMIEDRARFIEALIGEDLRGRKLRREAQTDRA